MNNLYRELAPVSDAAWEQIEEEAARTFKRLVAGRRVVDVSGPHGLAHASVGLGRLSSVAAPADGISAAVNRVAPLVELRVPFTLSRTEIDSVARGSQDADWDPLKDAAKQIAFAEDRAIFDGYVAAGIDGMRPSSSNAAVPVPASPENAPEAIAHALSELRLAGVEGPYTAVLGAELYTLLSETSDHGYPILEHIDRMVDGVVWAPAITGAVLLSTRGGDFTLTLGQDLAIGYSSHDTDTVELYFVETFTYLTHTAEASVSLEA